MTHKMRLYLWELWLALRGGSVTIGAARGRGPGGCGLPSGADQLQSRGPQCGAPDGCGLPSGADQLQSWIPGYKLPACCGLPSGADQLQSTTIASVSVFVVACPQGRISYN